MADETIIKDPEVDAAITTAPFPVVGEKIIKDPVHGYISIPTEYCQLFVDTPIFQRLRQIEQTSMRWLFPSARHDRFMHSLGVFHLASRIYDSILENVQDKEVKSELERTDSKKTNLRSTFLVASLMHDCGHAPFSHTFEKFYNRNADGSSHNETFKRLKEIVPKEDADDFDFTRTIGKKPPAHHEAMSAYVLLANYSAEMSNRYVDSGLAARMITGVLYRPATVPDSTGGNGLRQDDGGKKELGLREKVANALITLLNSDALDIDKLDYTLRDTWASGVKNTAIDMDRLIRGATIVRSKADGQDSVRFAFQKSAISVVQSVIDARNYLYTWVYGYHTVLYYSHLLEQAVVKFAEKFAKNHQASENSVQAPENSGLRRMFSPEIFCKEAVPSKQDDLRVYLLSDADILHFLKQVVPDDPDCVAYFSHKPHHISLWKTGADYRKYIDASIRFSLISDACVEKIRERFGLSPDECFACNDMTKKIYDLKDEDVQIEVDNGTIVPITELVSLPKHPRLAEENDAPLFYIYLDEKKKGCKEDIIKFINEFPSKKHDCCQCPYVPKENRCISRQNKPCSMLKE